MIQITDRLSDLSGLKRFFWLSGGGLFLIGLFGWYDRFLNGHLHANYGSVVTWGLWVALYIYFIGLSAGAFLISSLVYVFQFKQFERIGRIAVFTAVVTLLLALFCIWADLGHMLRAWHVLIYPNFKSPMAWMIWLYSAYFILLVLEMWLLLRGDLVKQVNAPGIRGKVYRLLSFGSTDVSENALKRDRQLVRILATIGVPVAIMFHGGVGSLFGVIAARPHWNSGLFPILFLLSALVSGGALLIVIAAIFQKGLKVNQEMILILGKLVLGLFLLDILFQISEMLVAFYGGVPGHVEGFKLVMFGPYSWVFWIWQIGLGTLVPVVILSTKLRHNARLVVVAAAFLIVGFIGLRLNIVIPALAIEEVKGLADAYSSARISTVYFPSIVEWLLSAGVFGLGFLLFGCGESLLPDDNL